MFDASKSGQRESIFHITDPRRSFTCPRPPFRSAACSARSSRACCSPRRRPRPRARAPSRPWPWWPSRRRWTSMAPAADLVGTIMQHVYEPLYTFDAKWNVVPMLAESMPKISADGKTYSHHAAQGRDAAQRPRAQCRRCGGEPAALDGAVAARQGGGARRLESLKAKGPLGVELVLKSAYAPLLAQLALPSGMAAIMAKDSIAQPLQRVRRHRPLQVQGAPARPVRAAHALRQVQRAQGARERLRRQARGGHRGTALRAGAQCQHARRGRAGRPVPLRRPAAGGSAAAPGEGRAARRCRS